MASAFTFDFDLSQPPTAEAVEAGDTTSAFAASSTGASASETAVPPRSLSTPASVLPLDDQNESVDVRFPSMPLLVPLLGDEGGALSFTRVDENRTKLSDDLVRAVEEAAGGKDTDLIPDVYEGGLKVWECSLDLVAHLHQQRRELGLEIERASAADVDAKGAPGKVPACLELGCGHGFPGIYVLQRARAGWSVCFSDFNDDVLRSVTWPNVLMNVPGDQRFRATYVAGDWGSLADAVSADDGAGAGAGVGDETEEDGAAAAPPPRTVKYDLIITAETCYTEKSTREVAALIRSLLRRSPSARALVASKRYYFGTGGSSSLFRDVVGEAGDMVVEVVRTFDDGASNIREVMELRWL